MRDFSGDHRWLSINTATLRKQRGVEQPLLGILDACADRGIRAVAPWRDQVAAAGLRATSQRLRDHGLALSGYCRGGMFTHTDLAGRRDHGHRALGGGEHGVDGGQQPARVFGRNRSASSEKDIRLR